jgi:two-component system chemotaxis response regulator CheB
MIRVLVVDDSATARALLVEILRDDPDLEVVGEAKDGMEAVALTVQLRPQIVTMDIHMPRMDGFAATEKIMATVPTPIVLITATMENREVEMAMNALRAGALGVLPKPVGPGSPEFTEAARKLVSLIKAMADVKVVRRWPERAPEPASRAAAPPVRPGPRARVVAVASSTGGPAALHGLLSELPGDFPVPVLVVQHITAGFVAGLADWLNTASNLRVKVAEDGEPLTPHTVYLAPDERHLGVSGRHAVALSTAPPVGGFRPSATYLFESVARAFGASAVAVILTGMGEDGVEGLLAVRQAGGRVIAQDESSSVVFGMPGAAIAAGLADLVVSLDSLPGRLRQLAGESAVP